MTKKLALIVTLAAMIGSTGFAEDFGLGFLAGIHHPTGDLGDVLDTGWNIQGFGEYFLNDNLALRLDLGYCEMEGEESIYGYTVDTTYSSLNLMPGIAYHLSDVDTPHLYMTFGGGLYMWELEASGFGISISTDESDVGVHGGIGFRAPMAGLALDVHAGAHYVFYEDDAEVNVTAGIGLFFGMM